VAEVVVVSGNCVVGTTWLGVEQARSTVDRRMMLMIHTAIFFNVPPPGNMIPPALTKILSHVLGFQLLRSTDDCFTGFDTVF
jgi:hypothetical protein